MSDLSSTEIFSWLALRLAPDMTRARFYALINRFKKPDAVFGARAADIQELRGFDGAAARQILDARRTVPVERELALMEKHGVRLITRADADYPRNLLESSLAPPLLYVLGALAPEDRFSVALVGSRQATQYGKAVSRQFAGRLAACGITVVSGFARGIDSQAHEAAIAARGRTVAVLGNGLAVCYPAENSGLRQRISEHGALISEYPMETSPDRYNFPERNHGIAALSLGTLVVVAALKSGALITARLALDENRFVFAVPGDINRANSAGTNALIQQGARLVQKADDILYEMKDVLRGYLREELLNPDASPDKHTPSLENGAGVPPVNLAQPATLPPASSKSTAGFSPDEQYIVSLIQHEPMVFDALAAQMEPGRISVQKLSSLLLNLELKQVIKQLPGRYYTVL